MDFTLRSMSLSRGSGIPSKSPAIRNRTQAVLSGMYRVLFFRQNAQPPFRPQPRDFLAGSALLYFGVLWATGLRLKAFLKR